MDLSSKFQRERAAEIAAQSADADLTQLTRAWFIKANECRYSYHFSWLDRPIIQYPQDIVATQELIWQIKPDLIIETGVAHGGSLVLSASMLALLEYAEAAESSLVLDPSKPKRKVIGIDIDIRAHNRSALEAHPMRSRIELIEGSSIESDVVRRVHSRALECSRVMVLLDSNHTHEHVLAELEAYAGLVTRDSYCVVFDTVIEDMPRNAFPDRCWGKGNNPKTAVRQFLMTHPEFEIDGSVSDKLQITVAPGGYLKRCR